MATIKSKKPAASKTAVKTKPVKPVKESKNMKNKESAAEGLPRQGWLQDASLEIPVPPSISYNKPGEREVEFSVGLRQQEAEGLVRSELRGRALIHANGAVLAMAEASYVNVLPVGEMPEDIAIQLYAFLRPHMEALLAQAGHTPPLPKSLSKVE